MTTAEAKKLAALLLDRGVLSSAHVGKGEAAYLGDVHGNATIEGDWAAPLGRATHTIIDCPDVATLLAVHGKWTAEAVSTCAHVCLWPKYRSVSGLYMGNANRA